MHRGLSRWLSVCVLGAVALAFALGGAEAGAGKKGTGKKEAGKPAAGLAPALDVSDALTNKDGRDKTAPDCYCKTYPIKLQQGATYQIDLRSKEFDAFLRLEDPSGKQVAEDDDSGGDLNSRIIYKAATSGEHKIIASTYKPNETGKFTLTVVVLSGPNVAAKEKGKEKVPTTEPKAEEKKVAGKEKEKGKEKVPTTPAAGSALKLEGGKQLTVKGELSKNDPKDSQGKYYKNYDVQLTAGKAYRIYMKGNPQLDAYLRLEDQAGKLLREDEFGEPNDSGINFSADKTAVYRIVATTYKAGMTGAFTLTINEEVAGKPPVVAKKEPEKKPTPPKPPVQPPQPPQPPAQPQVLTFTPGQPTVIQGALTPADPTSSEGKRYKAYRFQAQPGKLYRFEMAGQGNLDGYVRIADATGKTLKEEEYGDGRISRVSFTTQQPGSYQVIATTFKAGQAGKFTLTCREEVTSATQPPPITVKAEPLHFGPTGTASLQGKITTNSSKDNSGKYYYAYSFQAQAGKMYRFEANGSGGLDAELHLEDAAGKTIKNEDFGDGKVSKLNFVPAKSGEYRLVVSSYKPGMTGDYRLTAVQSEPRAAKVEAMPAFQPVVVSEVVSQLTAEDGIDKDGKFYKVFTFQTQPGKMYRVEMNGRTFDALLRLEDAKGTPIKNEDFFDGRFSQLFISPTKAGASYRVVASSANANQTGNFSLAIVEIAPRPGKSEDVAFERVSKMSGKITSQDGIDKDGKFYKAFLIKALPGMSYRCEMSGKGFDAYLRLEDGQGNPLKSEDYGDNKGSRLDFRADKSGTYRLIATTFKPGQSGEFNLTIVEREKGPPVKALALSEGKVVESGVLGKDDDTLPGGKSYKEYTFQAEAGRGYKIDLHSTAFDAYLYLRDEAGKTLAENDDFAPPNLDAGIVFQAAKSGTYRVIATTLRGGESGPFTLTIAAAKAAAAPAKVEKLDFQTGQATKVQGQLIAGDPTDSQGRHYKAYQFQAEAGKSYRFEMTGAGALDPLVLVQDPSGKLVKEEDFGDGKLSRLTFQAPQAGTYKVITAAFKAGMTGEYTLTAKVVDVTQAKNVPLNFQQGKAVVQAALSPQDPTDNQGRSYKAFVLPAGEGKSYRIEMVGKGSFDPLVRVEDATGKTVKEEDYGDGKVSRLVFKAGPAGSYRVVAGAFKAGTTGEFTLTVAAIEVKAAKTEPLKLEQGKGSVSGTLTADDGTDSQGKHYRVYSFQADKGKTYRFEMKGKAGLSPYVRIEDRAGKTLKEEDYGDDKVSRLFFKAPEAGSYQAIASTFKGGLTGEFTLEVAEVEVQAAKAESLKLDKGQAVAKAELTPADPKLPGGKAYKEYTFQAEAGKTYKIDLHSNAFDAYLYLKDGGGKTLAENDDNGESLDSRIIYKADQAGSYKIVATSLGGGYGPFVLTITAIELKAAKVEPLKLQNGQATLEGALTDQDGLDKQGKRYKVYGFEAQADKTYRFELKGKGGFDPAVRVEDPSGKVLKQEDYGDGKVSRVFFKPPQPGSYRVIATSYKAGATGAYTLTAAEVTAKAAKVVALKLEKGQAEVKSELAPSDPMVGAGKFYKEYTLQAEAGQTYKIYLHSKAFDAYLYLKDAQGKTLAQNDDFAPPNLDAGIVHKFDQGGTYHVIATSLRGGETGPFILTVGPPAEKDRLMAKVGELFKAAPGDRTAIVAELTKYFQGQGVKLTAQDAGLASQVAQALEFADKKLAREAYATFGKVLAANPDSKVAHEGKLLLGAARRLGLVGETMQVKGTTTDGKEFDLGKLKGKVVLVDFWATWCGPCRAELPNVKKLYQKYHDQGFEVIGISLDNTKDALTQYIGKEKLPWPSIFDQANDLADDYGVFSIPQAILVGRDGRVLSLNARGPELDRLLTQQFEGKGEKK